MRRPTSSHAAWSILLTNQPWLNAQPWQHAKPSQDTRMILEGKTTFRLKKKSPGDQYNFILDGRGPCHWLLARRSLALFYCEILWQRYMAFPGQIAQGTLFIVQSDWLARAKTTFSLVRVGKIIHRQEMMARKWSWQNGPRLLDRDELSLWSWISFFFGGGGGGELELGLNTVVSSLEMGELELVCPGITNTVVSHVGMGQWEPVFSLNITNIVVSQARMGE